MRFHTPTVSETKPAKEESIKMEEREIIARLRNCILALAQQRILLFDTTVQYTYDASLKHQVSVLILYTSKVWLIILPYWLTLRMYKHMCVLRQFCCCHDYTLQPFRSCTIIMIFSHAVIISHKFLYSLSVQVKELLDPEVARDITEHARNLAVD